MALPTRHLRRLASLVLLGLVTWGCPIVVNIPINRFDSPEARGRLGRVGVGVGVEEITTDIVVPDYGATPPVTNSRSFSDSSGAKVRVDVGIGLTRRLDVDLKVPFSAPPMVQLKYQLLGAPELVAKEGNASIAITVAARSAGEEGGSDPQANGVRDLSWKMRDSYFDVAAIFGKRPSDAVLIYGGPFHTFVGYSGNIDQQRPTPTQYPYSGHANQSGANLGVQLGRSWGALKLEAVWTLATDATARRSELTGGAAIGLRW